MRQISISELTSNVALWIREAATERQIVITDQGKPLAAIVPLFTSKSPKPLPDREERITRRSLIGVDSAIYISEMRD
jgi:prevent-host-death family protein